MLGLCITGLLVYLPTYPKRRTPATQAKKRFPKPLHPRSEDDCVQCRTTTRGASHLLRADPLPPWSTVKSPRGRKKSISTEGYACRNPACAYRLIMDAHHHALVADAQHGHDRIRDFCIVLGQLAGVFASEVAIPIRCT